MQIIKPNVNIDFVGRRNIAYGLSCLMILISIISLIAHGGPKKGIDFAGGAEVLLSFNAPVPIQDVKSALKSMALANTTVQLFGDVDSNQYRVLIPSDQLDGNDQAKDKDQPDADSLSVRLEQGLAAATQVEVKMESFEMVGPQVGNDLQEKAMMAMFFALLFITVYISGRFEFKWAISAVMAVALALGIYALDLVGLSLPYLMIAAVVITLVLFWLLNLKYAMGAIVALIHDVTITVGLFSLFGKEFTLPIIAALLTIIGYSLNDTIIVFDRIRENLRTHHKLPLPEIINQSVNQTLNRTILTSLTTLMVVVILLLFGGGIIHDFAFALTAGIVVGTYSSIFVASPILLSWQQRK
jgi:preprotein translocase subunit SecF